MNITSVTLEQKPEAYIKGWAAFFDGFNETDVGQFFDESSPEANQWILGLREARVANTPQEFDPNYINVRSVAREDVFHPWEPLRGVQPPTFASLVNYLQKLGIDPEGLELDLHAFPNGQTLRYGTKKLFWLPDEASEEEIATLEAWRRIPTNVMCPICNTRMHISSRITNDEESYFAACLACKIDIHRHDLPATTPAVIAKLIKNRR